MTKNNINRLLTEREGRTREYLHEVIIERTERSKDPTKNDKGQIFPSTARAS